MKDLRFLEKHLANITSIDELVSHINIIILKVIGSIFAVTGFFTTLYCYYIQFDVLMWGSFAFSLISAIAVFYRADTTVKNYIIINLFQLGLIIPITIVCVTYKGISGPIAYSYMVVPILALLLGGSRMAIVWLIISMSTVFALSTNFTWHEQLFIEVVDPKNLFLLLINQVTIAAFFILLKEINRNIINYIYDLHKYSELRTADLKDMIHRLSQFQVLESNSLVYSSPQFLSNYDYFDDISNSILKVSCEIQTSLNDVVKKAHMGEKLHALTHEFRNHLQIISGASGLIQSTADIDNPKVAKRIKAISNSISSLTSLTSRALYGAPSERFTTNLACVLDAVEKYAECLPHYKDYLHISVLGETDVEFYEIIGSLYNILINILKNSYEELKESTHKSPRIDLIADSRFEGYMRISIMDNGGGIPQEIIDQLNKKCKITSTKLDGSGLGLVFIKNECELNNFTLNIQSLPCFGTKITIDIESNQ